MGSETNACNAMLSTGSRNPAISANMPELPETTTHDGTLYCHASPLSDMDGFYAEAPASDAASPSSSPTMEYRSTASSRVSGATTSRAWRPDSGAIA